ncbi:MAG: 2-oxoacid:acceptor oxidoreductase family protein [Fibrobacter sp.]|jgi:indolepyruvate ferredoxin oxidoreductase beta subunit|nr:2-oxoacid:acceptor oxidoreductase family protein [Fibrobacter sp.]
METMNVKFAGLGGTGVLKASDIFAEVVFNLGYDVKKAEVHGMSQRGGSIASDVRYGNRVESPMIPDGTADYLIVFAEDQIPVNQAALKPGGILLTPKDIDLAKLPNEKALNVAMLGKLSTYFDFPLDLWESVLKKLFNEKFHETNAQAFKLGRS